NTVPSEEAKMTRRSSLVIPCAGWRVSVSVVMGISPEVRGAWDAGRTGEPAPRRHAIAAHNLRPLFSGCTPKVGTPTNILTGLIISGSWEASQTPSAIGRTPNVAVQKA